MEQTAQLEISDKDQNVEIIISSSPSGRYHLYDRNSRRIMGVINTVNKNCAGFLFLNGILR